MRKSPDDADRRVRKTRRQLRDALVTLILEKGWDLVSVQDVCTKADVGSSTFYVHFADKEDLLLSGFDDLHATLARAGAQAEHPFAFAEPLVRHAAENHDLFLAVAGRQSGQQIQWRFRDVVFSLVEAELGTTRPPGFERTSISRFIAGGFVEMLAAWLDQPSGVSPGGLALRFLQLATAATVTKPGSRAGGSGVQS